MAESSQKRTYISDSDDEYEEDHAIPYKYSKNDSDIEDPATLVPIPVLSTKTVLPKAQKYVDDISVTFQGEGQEYVEDTVEDAVERIRENSGICVVFADAPANLCTHINPVAASHMLKKKNRKQLAYLNAKLNAAFDAKRSKEAKNIVEQMSKYAPGLSKADMVNSYTTQQHLLLQDMQQTVDLMMAIHGKNYKQLHNRLAMRCRPHTKLELSKAELHKEGKPGDIDTILAFPNSERYVVVMPNEYNDPLRSATVKEFRKVSLDELTDPEGAHRVVSLRVIVPHGKIAYIIWDGGAVHGVDKRGCGISAYLSGASEDDIERLEKIRDDILTRGIYKDYHDPYLRNKNIRYYETTQIAFLMETSDQLWPSGKPIEAHGANGQGYMHNISKFINDEIKFQFRRDGTVEHGADMKAALEKEGIIVPQSAYDLPMNWIRDPRCLSTAQRIRWGFTRN